MIKTIMVATRDRGRLAEIVSVAARYGLDILLARLGLSVEPVPEPGEEPRDLPRRTREAIEALGPTYVKLGQILATRRDLLPDAWITEFEALQSKASTLPFEDLRAQVEAALGESPETAFARFDTTPLAAASIAQVHRATTHDGQEIVLKIRRPGIRRQMEADLRLIRHLAGMIETGSREARRYQPQALVHQLAQELIDELDFANEGRNADRLRADLADDDRVTIPQIHWQWTSETLLAMEYIEGVAPRNAQALRAAGIDPAAIADLGADLVLDMVLLNGRFHGDPHPGNLLCLPGNRLALIDLGLIGHVSPRRQQEFLRFVLSLNGGDPAALAEVLALWNQNDAVPRERILVVSERLTARHGGGKLILGALTADMFPLMREEQLVLPPDLVLIFKAMITMDGVLSGIEPDFDLSAALERARTKLLTSRLSAAKTSERAQAMLMEVARLYDDAPRLLRALVRRLEEERPSVPQQAAPEILAAAKWLAGGILLAAILIAGALFATRTA
jgi:ubiquinone biosynthesis protein